MPNRFLADYLNFTRKERVGIFAVLTLIIICLALPFFFAWFKTDAKINKAEFEKEIASLKISRQPEKASYTADHTDYGNYQPYNQPTDKKFYSNRQPAELFYFDPNTLSLEGWVKLGIREKTAATIKKYTAKGGKFYKPEDLAKIWGLHQDEVNRLVPYVRITQTNVQPSYAVYQQQEKYEPEKKFTPALIDINNADTAALIALPGIGSKLANRIIGFRDKLGGFYSIDQVAETYALPDSTFQKIKNRLSLETSVLKKININSATLDELKNHPYIRFHIARAIVEYRNMHGNFAALTDLKKIMIINEEVFDKASPYLTIK